MHEHWHTRSVQDVFAALQTTETGLSHAEAARRRTIYGSNELQDKERESLASIFLRQFQSPLIYLLLVACGIVFALGEIADGAIILGVLLFNAILGAVQEGRTQNTLAALKQYIETNATPLRDGEEVIVPDRDIVPGDIITLSAGERVPADVRIIRSYDLMSDESSLTGESKPVEKHAEPIAGESLPITDQKNMLFKGTTIVSGHGLAVVVATGGLTVMGSIAREVATIDTDIPLKANIRDLSHVIIVLVVAMSVGLFIIGVFRGEAVRDMFTTVVALAISVIPEGLPVVVTLVLVTGVWRMTKKHALVKRLQAVEGLGQARVIAVDKTGTLTKNEMTVQAVYVGDTMYEVRGNGYEPRGDIVRDGVAVVIPDHADLLLAAKIGALSTEAHVAFYEEQKRWRVFGDPTEASLVVLAEKCGYLREELEDELPKSGEVPFSFETKFRAIAHRTEKGHALVAIAGAAEAVMPRCTHVWSGGATHAFTAHKRSTYEDAATRLSLRGYRVLALAMKEMHAPEIVEHDIAGLTLVGLVGMKDPLRSEVADAMMRTREAGIRVVMITGDHVLTAVSVATEAGIYRAGDELITGDEIDTLSDEQFAKRVGTISVFARVTPEHKLRIITAYRVAGDVVAMTGDGVNDAPSLVAADLGVVMGGTGTEVAKEAADMILLDDNFGTIVSAVEEGRSIYKTIQKVLTYLFSTNLGEMLTITAALVIGYPLPLLPAQIIWLNVVTDTFLDVSLAMEPKEKGLLHGTGGKQKKYVLDTVAFVRSFLMASVMAVGTLALFVFFLHEGFMKAGTVAVTVLAVFQWFNAWNCRHESRSLFSMNPFSNPYLIAAMVTIVSLHVAALSLPFMQRILHTMPLTFAEWGLVITVASSVIVVEEIRKLVMRTTKRLARDSS